MKNRLGSLIILMNFILLSGCFSPVKVPTQENYFFNPTIHTVQAKPKNSTLLVSKPTAVLGYTSYRMAYIEKPSELAYYTRSRWIAPPADMLQPLLVESLQKTGRFKGVGASPFFGKTTYRLDSNLVYLRQNLTTMPHQMEIALQVSLVNNNDQRIMASRLLKRKASVHEIIPYASITVTNQLLEELLKEMTCFVLDQTNFE